MRNVGKLIKPRQIVCIGITDPISPKIETQSLGTTDDCGFSPIADDTSTWRDTAFAKIKDRVDAAAFAAKALAI